MKKELIGVVHLPPLPGSPRGSLKNLEEAEERVEREAKILSREGFTGIILENYGDKPYPKTSSSPLTVASMTRLVLKAREIFPGKVGVNILRNCGVEALSVAEVTGADFVRVNVLGGAKVTDQGIIEGVGREIAYLKGAVKVLADVDVKHSCPLGNGYDPLAEALDLVERGGADGLIITGGRTGDEADETLLRTLKENLPGTPVFVGSGVTPGNMKRFCEADGFIVGTYLRPGEGALEEREMNKGRVKEIVEAFRKLL